MSLPESQSPPARLLVLPADSSIPDAAHAAALSIQSNPHKAVEPSAAETLTTDGFFDWLHSHELPPGKVANRELPVSCFREGKDKPLRYITASEDLQVGDVAFKIPVSLVVTLERMLGEKSVGCADLWKFSACSCV